MIPFTLPLVDEDDIAAVVQAMRSRHLVGDGPISRRVEAMMERQFGVAHALLTPSCSHALELAMLVLGIGPGDEVIVPSFSFVSAANCVVLRGATPVFADILPDTLNLNPDDVERRITAHTRAIIPVHYAGVSCEMDALASLCRRHGLSIVEDAAQGVGATYQGRYLGTIGDIGCYSFHATKNITCGEGGAFLTNSEELARQAEIIREKGTDRSAFLRGEVDKYSWRAAGSSYLLSDLQAAMLETQLARLDSITAQRGAICERYRQGLASLEAEGLITLPGVPPGCSTNYHLFFFFARSTAERDRILTALREDGIGATFHFVPLHTSPYGRNYGQADARLPVTEALSDRLIRLPLYNELSPAEADRVVAATIRAVRAAAR